MKKIQIKGIIISNDEKWIYDYYEMDSTSPNDVQKVLDEANGEDLEVLINSGGGYVHIGAEIYTILKDYGGNVTVKIVGEACSAASVIAMAGNPTKISPAAQIMVHNSATRASGDYRVMESTAERLKNTNTAIANAYILKTGMSQEELLELMNKETWLNAQQAKEKGFVDEIMFDNNNQLVANHSTTNMLPIEVINKMRNQREKDQTLPETEKKSVNGVIDKKTNQKGEEKSMEIKNAEELKAYNSAIYDEIYNAGVEAGATSEKERLQGIDELTGKVDNKLLNEAKYNDSLSAEQVAFKAMKEGKFNNTTHISNAKKDAESANGVDGDAPGVTNADKDTEALSLVSNIAKNTINTMKGGN